MANEVNLTPRAKEALDVIEQYGEIDKTTIARRLKTSATSMRRALVELTFHKLVACRSVGESHRKVYSILAPRPDHVPVPETFNLRARERLVLDTLAFVGEMTVSQLAAHASISGVTVDKALRGLINLGLVEKHRTAPHPVSHNPTSWYRVKTATTEGKVEPLPKPVEQTIVEPSIPKIVATWDLPKPEPKPKAECRVVVRYQSGLMMMHTYCTDLASVHAILESHPEAEVYGPLEVKRSFEIVGLNK